MRPHESLVSGHSSQGAETTRLRNFTQPGQGDGEATPIQQVPGSNPGPHQRRRRRCLQISSSRGLYTLRVDREAGTSHFHVGHHPVPCYAYPDAVYRRGTASAQSTTCFYSTKTMKNGIRVRSAYPDAVYRRGTASAQSATCLQPPRGWGHVPLASQTPSQLPLRTPARSSLRSQ